jgi:excisionase family DNA binding protein
MFSWGAAGPMPRSTPIVESRGSVDDVVNRLGVARDTIYRWIEARGLPGHRIGKLWKFKVSEVDAWVEAGDTADGERGRSKPAKRQCT